MARIKLWDLPTRLCHWLLVTLVASAFLSENFNAMEWHGRIGLAILGVLTFRIVWGFIGSTYARFTAFVRGPASIKAYLRGEWQGVGHNPLGALSVLAILGVLAAQIGTGLFANQDSTFFGPLASLVSSGTSDGMTEIHEILEPVIIGLVALHLIAIAFYVRVKKDSLLKPMITGWKEGEGQNASGGGIFALGIALALALVVVYGASGALLPPSPLPVTPSW